jgi:dihydrofolate synthase/folylpolyglutamate synthase
VDDALKWLAGHVDYERVAPTRRALPTLEPVREALLALGSPEADLRIVHITGTNGKGSTTALTAALLGEEGLRVGTFTSPDLHTVNERISVAGAAVDDDQLVTLLQRLADLEDATSIVLTRFEILTVAALLHFSDEGVQAAVIEVGLGGTWDSTNVVTGEVAVVCNVSLDHTEVLGDTVEEIAVDKAGIIKPGAIAVIGEGGPTGQLLAEEAVERGASAVWRRGDELSIDTNEVALGGRLVGLTTPLGRHEPTLLSLHGSHQGANALCALAAAEAFMGQQIGADVVASAFATVRVPGRIEVLRTGPLIIVDGAHNPAGIAALVDALVEGFEIPGTVRAVVGILGNRDPLVMLEPLTRFASCIVTCCQVDSPRALPAEVLADSVTALGLQARVVTSVPEAVDSAVADAFEQDLVLVTGSLYVVGAARAHLLGLPPHQG